MIQMQALNSYPGGLTKWVTVYEYPDDVDPEVVKKELSEYRVEYSESCRVVRITEEVLLQVIGSW